jgi:hypothetical protein
LTIDGVAPGVEDIAALVSRPLSEVEPALSELETRRVFSRSETGAIYSRRMVRDRAKSELDKANGKKGGNPNLTKSDNYGVNPPDKAQKPEARGQMLEATSPLPSPVKKESSSCDVKREARSPPRNGITSQKHGRIYVVKGTPEWPPYAEDYRAATGKEPNVNEHGGRWFKISGEAAE